jgi:hypothetical protein
MNGFGHDRNGRPTKDGAISGVTVCYTSTDTTLQYGYDESYSLTVPTSGKEAFLINTNQPTN